MILILIYFNIILKDVKRINSSNDIKDKITFQNLVEDYKQNNFRDFIYDAFSTYSKSKIQTGITAWNHKLLNENFENTNLNDFNDTNNSNNSNGLNFHEHINIPANATEISFIILAKVDSVIL